MSFKLNQLEIQPDYDALKNWDDSFGKGYSHVPVQGQSPIASVKNIKQEKISIKFPLATETASVGITLQNQVKELVKNPDIPEVYLNWSGATHLNGYYSLEDAKIKIPEGGITSGFAEFDAKLTKLGRDDYAQRGLQLNKVARTTPFSLMTAQSVHGFPFASSVFSSSGTFYTREGSEGIIATVIDAGSQDIFPFEQAVTDIGEGDVRVYDDMVSSATRANWVEVYGPEHKFIGDVVVENGLVQLHSNRRSSASATVPGRIDHHFYNGTLYKIALPIFFSEKGGAQYGTTSPKISLDKVSPEESTLTLTYPPTANSLKVKLRLRRGHWQTEAKCAFTTGVVPGTFWTTFVNQGTNWNTVLSDAAHSTATGAGTYSTANATKNYIVGYVTTSSNLFQGMANSASNANPNQFNVSGSISDTLYLATGTDWISFFAVKAAGTVNDTPDDMGSQVLYDSKAITKLIRR